MHKAEPSLNEQDHFHRPIWLCEDLNRHATCVPRTSYRRVRRREKKSKRWKQLFVDALTWH